MIRRSRGHSEAILRMPQGSLLRWVETNKRFTLHLQINPWRHTQAPCATLPRQIWLGWCSRPQGQTANTASSAYVRQWTQRNLGSFRLLKILYPRLCQSLIQRALEYLYVRRTKHDKVVSSHLVILDRTRILVPLMD